MKRPFLMLPAMIALSAFPGNSQDRIDKVFSDDHLRDLPEYQLDTSDLENCHADNSETSDLIEYLRLHPSLIPRDPYYLPPEYQKMGLCELLHTISASMSRSKSRFLN